MIKKYSKNILITSLIINAFLILLGSYVVYEKGGVQSVFRSIIRDKSNKIELNVYQTARNSIFDAVPKNDRPIIFLGDSLTNNFEWQEMFGGNIKNRGVSGDTTDDIINRLDNIITLNPSKIFIMIGTNDVLRGKNVDDIGKNYDHIVDILIAKLPNTKIYIENVPPVDFLIFKDGKINDNERIIELNTKIKSIAIKHHLIYIDVYSQLVKDNQLNAQLTYDGLHLNGNGYKIWCNAIKQYVNE